MKKSESIVYLERDWSVSAKAFALLCTVAIICRLASLALCHFGLHAGSFDPVAYTLHSTLLIGTVGVLHSELSISNLFSGFLRQQHTPEMMFFSMPKPVTTRMRSNLDVLHDALLVVISMAALTNHILLGSFLIGFQLIFVSMTWKDSIIERWYAMSWRHIRALSVKLTSLFVSTTLSIQCDIELARRWENFGVVCGTLFPLACLFMHGFLLLRGWWISRRTPGWYEALQLCYLFDMTRLAFALRFHLSEPSKTTTGHSVAAAIIELFWSVASFCLEGEMAWGKDERNYGPGFEDLFGLSPGTRYHRRLPKLNTTGDCRGE
jgi:hypothetical protein